MPRWKPFGCLLVFLVPTLPWRGAWLADRLAWPGLAAWCLLFALFVLLPLLDHLTGRRTANPADGGEARRLDNNRCYRLITLARLPALAPPLWFAVMNPRVDAFRARDEALAA